MANVLALQLFTPPMDIAPPECQSSQSGCPSNYSIVTVLKG